MSSADDIVRAQVVSLFSRCENDVPRLVRTITRALNEVGRRDVSHSVSDDGASVTISQSLTNSKKTSLQETLDRLVSDAKRQLAEYAAKSAALKPQENSKGSKIATQHPSTAPRAELSAAAMPTPSDVAHKVRVGREGSAKYRTFPKGPKERKELPSSNFNGNMLLRKYAGPVPPHQRYGFYRRFGYDGRGGATSEFHNKPNGERPHCPCFSW
jgi:predicted transcriptional regulator